jgi:hypothetical protein
VPDPDPQYNTVPKYDVPYLQSWLAAEPWPEQRRQPAAILLLVCSCWQQCSNWLSSTRHQVAAVLYNLSHSDTRHKGLWNVDPSDFCLTFQIVWSLAYKNCQQKNLN